MHLWANIVWNPLKTTPQITAVSCYLLPWISSGRPEQQRAARWPNWRSVPSSRCLLHNCGGNKKEKKKRKKASKSDSQSGLSRMESVCAGEGFYQRLTLTGIPVWDCPSNSCVPQEAVHKKQPKTPGGISYVARRLAGSTETPSYGFSIPLQQHKPL